MTGTIPTSDALREASAESLDELMNRSPEEYTDEDLDRVIGVFRAQRQRFADAEAAGRAAPKVRKTTVALTSVVGTIGAEDLGL